MESPVKRWDVINAALKRSHGRRFLEIGVQRGLCGRRVRAAEKWGVDPAPIDQASTLYSRFYCETSDAFFERPGLPLFDVIFIDGLHEARQVLRDVDNSLRHLAPGGFILLHDCNPQKELHQRVPRASGVWNGDCWKAMVALRQRPDLEAFTLDCDEGIGVVRKGKQEPIEAPAELSWELLQARRQELLGLRPPGEWLREAEPKDELGKVVVVTAIFGGRDEPRPAPMNDVDRYVMFTDGEGASGWEVRRSELEPKDHPRMVARGVKAAALSEFPDADVIVWVDGRIKVQPRPLRPLLQQALAGCDIAGYPHPWRKCAYAEAEECRKLGLANSEALEAQVAYYREAGLPPDCGLWNTMVLARRNTPVMVQLGFDWWHEIRKHTPRDQISLPYLLWRSQIKIGRLGRDVYYDKASMNFQRGAHARNL